MRAASKHLDRRSRGTAPFIQGLFTVTKICKMLLVEDQQEIQDLCRELFATEGYRFIIVGDGPAMRHALAEDCEIDVAIIDVLLPGGVDGMTLAAEVAARGLPVILVTGDHSHAERLAASGHRYLLKPFTLATFIALIDATLHETKANCERDSQAAAGACSVDAPLPSAAQA
jgi:DNA-binding response OmpR family regulator